MGTVLLASSPSPPSPSLAPFPSQILEQQCAARAPAATGLGLGIGLECRRKRGAGSSSSARIISNSSSLIQRATRECSLLQPPAAGRVYWQASSFDGGSGPPLVGISSGAEKRSERNKRSDTAKRHVLARQRPIEQEEARDHSRSPLGHRR